MVEAEKEKIESKGAYSYDLHKAIRGVSSALGNENYEVAETRLLTLYDLCAPEIREAVASEWHKLDREMQEEFDKIDRMDIEVYDSEVPPYRSRRSTDHLRAVYRVRSRKRNAIKLDTHASFLHRKFQAVIDCLDRHGELRKWRNVEYGKV